MSLCKDCGKPPDVRPGSVTSYLFQHNYCQCARDLRNTKKAGVSSSVRDRSGSANEKNRRENKEVGGQTVCQNCGKAKAANKNAGSFTAFLFKELRCTCGGAPRKAVVQHSNTAQRVAERKQFTRARLTEIAGRYEGMAPVLPEGAIIGGAFRIVEVLGVGGMGVVYGAVQMALQKKVALKVLLPELVNEQSWLRFQAEARTLAALQHETFVRVYDLGIHERVLPFYSMEYLHGQSLEQCISDRGQLNFREALPIFVDVLDGLSYAHRNGIIHRDLKPGNIMLCAQLPGKASALQKIDDQLIVKILDFGISKFVGPQTMNSQSLTSVGEIFGSPFYMSPEQCLGGTVDARSDIYSIGCTLFEVLTGCVPFEARSSVEIAAMQQDKEPPALVDVAPDIQFPDALEFVIEKCLAKDPGMRYQTAKELSLDLNRVLDGKDLRAYRSSTPRRQTDGQSRAERNVADDRANLEVDAAANLATKKVLVAGSLLTLMLSGFVYFLIQNILHRPGATPQAVVGAQHRSPSAIEHGPYISAEDLPAMHPNKPVSTSDVPFNVDDRNMSPLDSLPDPMGIVSSEGGIGTAPPSSLKDSSPFSSLTDGGQVKSFHFPTDVVIGSIQADKSAGLIAAKGVVKVSPQKKVIFMPGLVIRKFPQYLSRFRRGDISSIALRQMTCCDKILAACGRIPGIESLIIMDSLDFTDAGIVPALNQFKTLKNLSGSLFRTDGKVLAKATCWNNLTQVSLTESNNVGPFLRKLSTYGTCKLLTVADCRLSHDDFEAISTIRSLEYVSVNYNSIRLEDLRQLAKLPDLQDFSMVHCGMGYLAIPELKKIKKLRRLQIFSSTTPDYIKKKFAQELPGVQVE